jgi:Tol biopolymer transport system component
LLLALAVAAVSFCSGCVPGVHPATYITDRSATLNGRVVSLRDYPAGSYWFEYGTTTEYGTETVARPVAFPNHRRVSQPVAGLAATTGYHYRVCVQDRDPQEGSRCSEDATFTTGPVGGRSGIAFTSNRDIFADEIYAADANGANPTRLTNNIVDDAAPAWSPDGTEIAFERDLDVFVMDASGSNQANLTNHQVSAQPAWSPDGTKVAFAGIRNGIDIIVINSDGTGETNLTNDPTLDINPAWSPDGQRIAFVTNPGDNADIWVMDAAGNYRTRLTTSAEDEFLPAWSPDGSKIAFTSTRDGNHEVYLIDLYGGTEMNLTDNPATDEHPTWSPDGSKIAFHTDRDAGNGEIYVMDPSGNNPTNLTNNGANDRQPSWSPRP